MDYCHQCRRHLNGALACAGCGTPVEELRHLSPGAPAADHVVERDEVSDPVGHRRSRRQPAPRRKPPSGRRARKRRGRKVLLGTFGLLLAAGALSLAELAYENAGDDGAATSVKEEESAETEAAPEPTDDVTPEGPDEVNEPAVASSGPARPARVGSGPATGIARTGTRRPSATVAAIGTPSASPSPVDASGSAEPSASGDPSASAPGRGSAPPSANPQSKPSLPKTCDRFFWWCI